VGARPTLLLAITACTVALRWPQENAAQQKQQPKLPDAANVKIVKLFEVPNYFPPVRTCLDGQRHGWRVFIRHGTHLEDWLAISCSACCSAIGQVLPVLHQSSRADDATTMSLTT
jgi:hypothetical protein